MEVGNEKENLILKTSGKLKIQWGRKFIDLLDNNGNLNITHQQIIKSANSIDDITKDGIYVVDGDVVISFNGNIVTLSQSNSKKDLENSEDDIKSRLDNLELKINIFDLDYVSDILINIIEFLQKAYPLRKDDDKYYGFYLMPSKYVEHKSAEEETPSFISPEIDDSDALDMIDILLTYSDSD